jgi:hypothetical protein
VLAVTRIAAMLGAALCACAAQTQPGAPTWTQIATPNVPPRWGQTAQYDAARDTMLAFGGENASGKLSELLVLHLDTLAWDRIDTSASVYPRTDLGSALDTLNGRLVIIGGRIGLATSIRDVDAMDLVTQTWTHLPPGPPPRHDISVASDGNHAWVFGGAGGFLQSLDDLWQLDFATDTWTELPQPGARPAARGSMAFEYAAGALYLVGGHDATMPRRDAWRYDLVSGAWTQLAITSAPPAWAHFGHGVDASCDRVVLVAGDNLDSLDTSLATQLDLQSATFARVWTSNLPPARDHPSLIVDTARRQLVLYGGGTLGDGLGTLADAWALPLGACP